MRIKHLPLRAKTVVEGFYNGLHRSPFHGFSVEFSEYRPYSPGDDPRSLDWKLYARSDRYYVKRFEDETNRRCYLLVDQSRSMRFGSLAYGKAEYARTVAATLAYYLTLQRDNVGLLTFDAGVGEFLPARHRPGHLHRLMGILEHESEGRGTDLTGPLGQIAALIHKRGLVVLISDLLAPIDALKTNLAYLRSRGHEVLVLRVLDPREVAFTLDEPAMVTDMETGREMFVDPRTAEQEYRRRFAEHEDAVRGDCAALGVDFARLRTDEPLEQALFDLVASQRRRGRSSIRGRAAAGAGGVR